MEYPTQMNSHRYVETLKKTVKYFLIKSFVPNFVKMIILEPINWFLEISNLHFGKAEKNRLKIFQLSTIVQKIRTNDPFLTKMTNWRIDRQTHRQKEYQ